MVSSSTPTGNVDLDQVESWLQILHGASTGVMHVCSTASWAGRVFQADSTTGHEAALDYIRELDTSGVKGIYLRATTLIMEPPRDEEGRATRGGDDLSRTFPGFWADIDIAGPGHKTTKTLPANVDEAMSIVTESGLPTPTYWVHSGGGLYPWWLLDNPVEIENTAYLTRTQEVSARWHELLRDTAERLGMSYGPVGDLARVLRIPGTVNRKVEGDPRPCRIMEDVSEGRLYTMKELVGALEAGEKVAATHRPTPAPPAPKPTVPKPRAGDDDERPGDRMANQMSWDEIMSSGGYQFDRTMGEETFWVRPGKNRRDGHSCTTNYGGSDLLYVFSTEMEGFEPERSYSKFATWAILNGHGADFKSAAKALAAQGYGSQRQPASPPRPFEPGQVADGGGSAGEPDGAPQVVHGSFTLSDVGNARRMASTFGNWFRHVGLQGEWMRWNGKVWEVDETASVSRAAVTVTDSMLEEADRKKADDEAHDPDAKVCRCYGCKLGKHAITSQSDSKVKAMVNRFAELEGIAASPSEFDRNDHLVTVGNGVLDLRTLELGTFDSRHMLTNQVAANYDPEAKAPRFEAFMEQVLPSAELRDYVQRAVGYSLTGENSERAMFLVHGQKGTGKSQFLTIMESLFGDLGGTAEASTFEVTRSEATNNLHTLRGKRFVSISETANTATLDEVLVKRVTGGDNVTTRELYQKNITWRPKFAIWMATNFPPKMDSDDGAIWDRYKPIHFGQQFTGGDVIRNLGKQIFEAEAAGILNWILEGLKAYRERGLGEPSEVVEAVAAHQLESDNVAQFLQDATDEGLLVRDSKEQVKSSTLFAIYDAWCTRQRLRGYGQKRFSNRMRALEFEQVKNSSMYWVGLRATGQTGLLGTMG